MRVLNAGRVRTITERNCLLKTDDLHDIPNGAIFDATYAYDRGHTGYERHIRPGCFVSQITASGLWVPTKRSLTNGAGAGATALIVDNANPFKVGDTVSITGKKDSIKITDADGAAAAGVLLYLHLDEKSQNGEGHLEFVSPTNAAGSFTTISGSLVEVNDDDAAATAGVALYFDEDGADGAKLLAAVPNGKDAYIFDSAGRAIKIKYVADPTILGVALYFDEDGAANGRVQFVSPTNANGSVSTDSTVGLQATITKSSGLTVSAITSNTMTIGAATWVDGDDVIASGDLAGAEIARGILHDWLDLYDPVTRDYVDCTSPSVAIAGTFIKSAITNDVDAIVEADKVSNGGPGYLTRIKFDTDIGAA